MKKIIISLFALGLLFGCAPQKEIVKEKVEVIKEVIVEKEVPAAPVINYEIPPDWKDADKKAEKIKYFAPYLNDIKFFIDPGHGGTDRRGKSQDGKIVEADVNLRVALFLRGYLEKAGARVILSRDADSTVDLKYRSVLANNSGADYFISIHHNAPGKDGDNSTNFTSTFYHATEEDYEYEACERDLARFIQRDLSYVMGNPNGLGSFDGTYSDYNIYPKEGFSVLRRTEIPSVLVEASFFTNNREQQRLNNEEFNDIQAWGIFRGIGRYLVNGIPTVSFIREKTIKKGNDLSLQFLLKDEKGINKKSIEVLVDKKEVEFEYSTKDGILSIKIKDVKKGEHEVKVTAANKNGNHTLPFIQKVIVK
ncbi:MAG: N-acetylmuramoyl-L-alanine amidase [bacterium]